MYVYGTDGNSLGYMPDTLATVVNNSKSYFEFVAADLWIKFS